jgi:quinol monooxygenase YgiN
MDTSKKSDLIVIAVAKAKSGNEHDLNQALREVAGPTRAQPGCISFGLYRSTEDPCVILGIERWASEEAHDRHLQGAHVQRLMSKMMPVLAEPPSIVAYEVIDEA